MLKKLHGWIVDIFNVLVRIKIRTRLLPPPPPLPNIVRIVMHIDIYGRSLSSVLLRYEFQYALHMRGIIIIYALLCICWAQSVDLRNPWIALRNLWIHALRRNPWIAQESVDLDCLRDLTICRFCAPACCIRSIPSLPS